MPAGTDDDIPESAMSRLGRRWGNMRVMIRTKWGAEPITDMEREDTRAAVQGKALEVNPLSSLIPLVLTVC
jgi:hypothetical protein